MEYIVHTHIEYIVNTKMEYIVHTHMEYIVHTDIEYFVLTHMEYIVRTHMEYIVHTHMEKTYLVSYDGLVELAWHFSQPDLSFFFIYFDYSLNKILCFTNKSLPAKM